MSGHRIRQAAYSDARLRGEDLRVLLALEAYPDRQGYRWPSQGRLADELGMSRPNVNRAIRRLEEFGYLVKPHRSGRRTCAYYLTTPTAPAGDDDTRSCIKGDTQAPKGIETPSVGSPFAKGGTIAASDALGASDNSPDLEKGGGQAAATPPPGPRPSDRGGGARLPANVATAANGIARQVGRSKACASRSPPDDPLQRALNSGVLTDAMCARLIGLADRIGEEAALAEFGFTRRGSPKGKPP